MPLTFEKEKHIPKCLRFKDVGLFVNLTLIKVMETDLFHVNSCPVNCYVSN